MIDSHLMLQLLLPCLSLFYIYSFEMKRKATQIGKSILIINLLAVKCLLLLDVSYSHWLCFSKADCNTNYASISHVNGIDLSTKTVWIYK